MSRKPIIGITMGDAAGIGPEVTIKALGHPELFELCRPVVIGDLARLQLAARLCGSTVALRRVDRVGGPEQPGVEVLDVGGIPADLPFGELSAQGGDGAYRYVAKAAELAIAGSIDAICTAPLNKEALRAAGHDYPGHTELLADLCGVSEVSMLLCSDQLRVIHVTTHIGLLDAIELIDDGLVYRTIARGHRTLIEAGIENPRVAVCGINPHAGENGLFGHGEETTKIEPAIRRAVSEGMDVTGPLPADTVFFRVRRGDFDIAVAMYHDQGHGPIKVLGLDAGVNITVGLPVVRTSVDHGTAFDIAGTGVAEEQSMLQALSQAVTLAPHRGGATREAGIA